MGDPLLLHIETSTSICSVALSRGTELLGEKESDAEKVHSTMLTVFIDEVLKQAGIRPDRLDAVCISKGPGSYTGLRIGVSTTKGLAYGLDIPVIGINSLAALAHGMILSGNTTGPGPKPDNILLCPMIDARRMEVYTALFDMRMNTIKDTSAMIIDSHSFSKELNAHQVLFFGNGAFKLKGVIEHPGARIIGDFVASARHMIPAAVEAYTNRTFEDTAYFEPFYLKDFVATTPKNKVI